MVNARNDLSWNLGSLQASTWIELHTRQAARHFFNRQCLDKRGFISGLTWFMRTMSMVHDASANDDPYADWVMLIVEAKLNEVRKELTIRQDAIKDMIAKLPERFTIGKMQSSRPIQLSIAASSPLAFQCAYWICDFDEYTANVLMLRHIGILPTATGSQMIEDASHLFRSLTTLVQFYQNAGVTRDDMAANNAKARAAIEKFGLPPQDILEGTRRSQFAPVLNRLKRQRGNGASERTEQSEAATAVEEDRDAATEDVAAHNQAKGEVAPPGVKRRRTMESLPTETHHG